MAENSDRFVRWFDDLTNEDVAIVGGKNASLGEMIRSLKEEKIRVPDGFATTSDAYRRFLAANEIEEKISSEVQRFKKSDKNLQSVGKNIRRFFLQSEFPAEVAVAIREAYGRLSQKYNSDEVDVAVRSSATAEDLPEASFAGQLESYLNVTGEKELLDTCRKCYASLFTDRAIAYREENGFDHMKIALSVGVQKMVRSDRSGSGVMFSIDTETGMPEVVVINAAWGLGENVVQGTVNPDQYTVFKPLLEKKEFKPIVEKKLGIKEKKMVYSTRGQETTRNVDTTRQERQSFVLSDEEILTLGRWAKTIERHYEKAMDIEWAKDGDTNELFIVQARPETVQSQKGSSQFKSYKLKSQGKRIVSGLSIGQSIASGKACVIMNANQIDRFEEDAILVTSTTDPDWVPIMKRASGIITDYGGRTSHAAIVSRELGIPAVVGCENATDVLKNGQEVTLSCVEGDQGYVYEGILEYEEREISLEHLPETRTQMMINIASPAASFRWWRLPAEGIGLARMEFIINNIIKIHPMALLHFDELEDKEAKKQIEELTRGFGDRSEFFVSNLAWGIAKIAAPVYPHPAIVRMSDFKTNEYADLIGGKKFEPEEENPMLGWRGASRYYSENYQDGFALECRAIKRVRDEIGMDNVIVMIPFCRTLSEADKVIAALAKNGLIRGENGLKIYVMVEIPSNVILAEEFAQRFDGFSIGSNDLTQLTLGVDRDSAILSELFDERDEAVKRTISELLQKAHRQNTKVGICGQAPSDYPDFAVFLVENGIDSISLNPDSFIEVKERIAEVERQLQKKK